MAKELRTRAFQLVLESYHHLSPWESMVLRTTLKTKMMFYGRKKLQAIIDDYEGRLRRRMAQPYREPAARGATARVLPKSPIGKSAGGGFMPVARGASPLSSLNNSSEVCYAEKFKAALRLAAKRVEVPLDRHIDEMLMSSPQVVRLILENHPVPSPYEILVDAIEASTPPADRQGDYVVLFRNMLLEAVHCATTATTASAPSVRPCL